MENEPTFHSSEKEEPGNRGATISKGWNTLKGVVKEGYLYRISEQGGSMQGTAYYFHRGMKGWIIDKS